MPLETLSFLVHTTSNAVIRIYAYLLNKSVLFSNYRFTLKELASEALGRSPSTNGIENTVNDCLSMLGRLGLIDYVDVWENYGAIPIPKKKLIGVSTELKKFQVKTEREIK